MPVAKDISHQAMAEVEKHLPGIIGEMMTNIQVEGIDGQDAKDEKPVRGIVLLVWQLKYLIGRIEITTGCMIGTLRNGTHNGCRIILIMVCHDGNEHDLLD